MTEKEMTKTILPPHHKKKPKKKLDEIDEAGMESFPASDPPSWVGGKEDKKE